MAQNKLQIVIAAKDTTGKVFRGLNRALAGVGRSILSMKTALVGLAGAAGLGLLVKSSLDSIDALGKTASKLGVTTAELQKLRYASELAGVETRTVIWLCNASHGVCQRPLEAPAKQKTR